jgi:hypothetical protein
MELGSIPQDKKQQRFFTENWCTNNVINLGWLLNSQGRITPGISKGEADSCVSEVGP